MDALTILTVVYFAGVAVSAGLIVYQGLTGRWSKGDWPAFALIVPWFWPLLLPLVLFGNLVENIYEPWRYGHKDRR